MSITIKELVQVAAEKGLTKVKAEEVILAVFAEMGKALKDGQEVTIRDFGRFYIKTYPARTGRNPKTGESVQVPQKDVVKFVVRGAMKE